MGFISLNNKIAKTNLKLHSGIRLKDKFWKIRPHHLLCLLGFHGLGYSRKFVANMKKVKEKLSFDSTFPIKLVVESDIICAACPYNKRGKCLKIKIQDFTVLQKLDFEIEFYMPINKIWEKVKEEISIGDMIKICQDCDWLKFGYCIKGLKKLKQI